MREQRGPVEREQRVAVGQVVGDVEEAAAAVVRGRDEVRVLDQAHERQRRIGDVGPVVGAEGTVELEQ